MFLNQLSSPQEWQSTSINIVLACQAQPSGWASHPDWGSSWVFRHTSWFHMVHWSQRLRLDKHRYLAPGHRQLWTHRPSHTKLHQLHVIKYEKRWFDMVGISNFETYSRCQLVMLWPITVQVQWKLVHHSFSFVKYSTQYSMGLRYGHGHCAAPFLLG